MQQYRYNGTEEAKMKGWLLCLSILSLISLSQCQNIRASRKNKPKNRPNLEPGNSLFKALTINYPLSFFDLNAPADWRTKAIYSSDLVQATEPTRSWMDYSFAQDQEDVWLYENWFYGMTKGTIMESGALNGILFSNSHFFETFANWTAVHVGENNNILFRVFVFSCHQQ
jgi:hypothetical protein